MKPSGLPPPGMWNVHPPQVWPALSSDYRTTSYRGQGARHGSWGLIADSMGYNLRSMIPHTPSSGLETRPGAVSISGSQAGQTADAVLRRAPDQPGDPPPIESPDGSRTAGPGIGSIVEPVLGRDDENINAHRPAMDGRRSGTRHVGHAVDFRTYPPPHEKTFRVVPAEPYAGQTPRGGRQVAPRLRRWCSACC